MTTPLGNITQIQKNYEGTSQAVTAKRNVWQIVKIFTKKVLYNSVSPCTFVKNKATVTTIATNYA